MLVLRDSNNNNNNNNNNDDDYLYYTILLQHDNTGTGRLQRNLQYIVHKQHCVAHALLFSFSLFSSFHPTCSRLRHSLSR